MKIKIMDNASGYYRSLQLCGGRGNRCNIFNEKWYEILKKIDGKTLEVETKYLFKDQFNTVPIKDVSEQGLRIMGNMVDEVMDDVRIDKKKCCYCGTVTENINKKCPKCNKSEYFEEWNFRTMEELFRNRGYDMGGNKYPVDS